MMRTRLNWSLFAIGLLVAGGLMAYVSVRLFDLDAQRQRATRDALAQESVRLALWRMDSELTPLVTEEAARPYFHYLSFYPAERPYARMFEPAERDEALIPSPLLSAELPQVVVHFQIAPDGEFHSPQAPDVEGANAYIAAGMAAEARTRLKELRGRVTRERLLERLPRREAGSRDPVKAGVVFANSYWQSQNENQHEYAQRSDATMRQAAQRVMNSRPKSAAAGPVELIEGPMTALWLDGRLVLARRISVDGREYVQGCLLNWERIRQDLLGAIQDLAPNAALKPANEFDKVEPANVHRLAALPVEVIPGVVPVDVPESGSPLRATVFFAWACLALVAGGLAYVMHRTLSLARRRTDFVSAVSHELRTPLTTFRMYTEMLRDGMVNDEAARTAYLDTLHTEALRLGHLVENVLAYARLENSSAAERMEELALSRLLERATERIRARSAQAGMELVIEPGSDARIRTDAGTVEQILFNLVDNACKYAGNTEDRRIHLGTRETDRQVEIRVRDHGPGVGRDEGARLFKPFRKSAQAAAESAPGVGLGLALSRRLARAMGGDLRQDETVKDGACFVLTLPRA